MKRFVLFWCPRYYPSGGFHDTYLDFDELHNAIEKGIEILKKEEAYYHAHVYDIKTKSLLWDKTAEEIVDGE